MNQIDDEEMFLMINPLIALERQLKIELEVLGSYPDRHDYYHAMDLRSQQIIDDEWDELINEVFPNVGW